MLLSFTNTEEVFDYLSKHLELVPFMSIYVIDKRTRNKSPNSQNKLIEVINHLGLLYNDNAIKESRISNVELTPKFTNLTGYHQRIYHTLVYAGKKLKNARFNKYEKDCDLLKGIIEFSLYVSSKFNNIFISIDEEKLINEISKPSIEVLRFESYHKFRLSLISRLSNTLTTEEEVISELKRMIEIMSLTVDSNTSYFPQHPLQTSFERVLMSPLLPYKNDIQELIDNFDETDPQMFVDAIFEEVVIILKDLRFTEKRHDMALVLLLYRYIFDNVYQNNSILNRGSESNDMIAKIRRIPVKNIELPEEYCPTFSDNQTAMSIFKNDPHFSKAIEKLEETQWNVNPFDILFCVSETIHELEKCATFYSREDSCPSVFPFEVMFSLFMGVLLSSQIPNWANIVDFVIKYTPQTGLSSEFEYARAKMEATREECKTLFFTMQKQNIERKAAEIKMRSLQTAQNVLTLVC